MKLYFLIHKYYLVNYLLRPEISFVAILVSLLLILLPILELGTYKVLIDLLFRMFEYDSLKLQHENIYVIGLLGLLLLSFEVVRYYSNITRIKCINSWLSVTQDKTPVMQRNWLRSLLVEISISVIALVQIIMLVLLLGILVPLISVVTLAVVMASILFAGFRFKREYYTQVSYHKSSKVTKIDYSSRKIESRIKSSELASLLAQALSIMVIIIAIIARAQDLIDNQTLIIVIFASRYLGTALRMHISTLMRSARALSYIRPIIK